MEEKYFELCSAKRTVNKILKEFEQGIDLNYDDDTELCFYREQNFSVYLAVYDETLCWTFSEHFDENDLENVGAIDYTAFKPNTTAQDLQSICESILPIAKKYYEENGGYDNLDIISFLELEEKITNLANTEYSKVKKEDTWNDIYEHQYDYDDLCIIVAIMDFISLYDTKLDEESGDVEDIVILANTIKEKWLEEFKTLSHEQKGYIGVFTQDYLKERYL